jgi:hypothetical protein
LIYANIVIKYLHHKGYGQLEVYMEDLSEFLSIEIPKFGAFWCRSDILPPINGVGFPAHVVNKMKRDGVKFSFPSNGNKIAIAMDPTKIRLVNDSECRTEKYKDKVVGKLSYHNQRRNKRGANIYCD